MAAPRYVPSPAQQKKYYESTRKVKHSSALNALLKYSNTNMNNRNKSPGPDQGYALRLVKDFKGKIFLFEGEHWEDASEVAVLTALKRASLFGRAPCNHDLEAGFCIWGYLDSSPQEELLEIRKEKFGHIGSAHNYLMRRYVSDAVSAAGLKRPLVLIQDDYESNWGTLVDPSKLDES